MNKIKSRREKRFSVLLTIVMVLVMVITVYPVWYSLINSLNSAQDIAKNGYAMLLPGEFSLESWKSVLKNTDIFRAFGITLSRTLIVTVVQTLFTAMFAYGFSRDNLVGKKFYTVLGFISMYLNGGVIAYFILFNAMHIYNSYWVYILPALFGGFYNVIIFNTNFKAIPESLFESAKIDGASEYTIFFRLVIPPFQTGYQRSGDFYGGGHLERLHPDPVLYQILGNTDAVLLHAFHHQGQRIRRTAGRDHECGRCLRADNGIQLLGQLQDY